MDSTSEVAEVGRILGGEDAYYTSQSQFSTLTNNYAWSGMMVTGEGYTPDVGADNKDGTNVTTDGELLALWETLGFTGEWWAAQPLPDLSGYATFALTIDLSQLAAVTVTTSGGGLTITLGTEDGYCWNGDTVTVTATPNEGWTFSHWQNENGEIVSYDSEYRFEAEGDITLIAVFEQEIAPIQAKPTGLEITTLTSEPRKEPDPVIVPDNDDEANDPDGNNPSGGNDGDGNDGGGSG